MKINIVNLDDGEYRFHYEKSADSFKWKDTLSFQGKISADVQLFKTEETFYLKITSRGLAELTCDRCLTIFEKWIDEKTNFLWILSSSDSDGEDADEIHYIQKGESVIDITPDVRDMLLLGLPVKILCKDDCAGLCPHCGKDLNNGLCKCNPQTIDPRWEKLSNLNLK